MRISVLQFFSFQGMGCGVVGGASYQKGICVFMLFVIALWVKLILWDTLFFFIINPYQNKIAVLISGQLIVE